jgi:alkylation response protein AidB-like acyl-CoA dehydrogenase
MNFDLSEEQQLICATVERFLAPIDGEARRKLRALPGGYDRDRWRELAGLGLIALAAGADAGGMGGTPIDLALVGERIGRSIGPDPWLENGVIPALLLAGGGGTALLEAQLAGEAFAAFAFAERAQRYSLMPKATVARAAGDGFMLRGEKTMVLGGAIASHFIVTADCDGRRAFFAVPADRPGLVRHDYRLADGSIACELRLINVQASADERLDIGAQSFDGIVAQARLLAAAEMLGLAQRLFDETLAYVKQREQFGVAIGSFQALQHRLVECYAALEQARSMLYRAALSDAADPSVWARAAAGAKAFIGDQADLVGREAVQMHGGMGITDELSIGHAFKRILLLARLFGDGETALADYAEAA